MYSVSNIPTQIICNQSYKYSRIPNEYSCMAASCLLIISTVKPTLNVHSRGNLYCPFNRGVRLKEVLIPKPLIRYDLKDNNIVYFIDYQHKNL